MFTIEYENILSKNATFLRDFSFGLENFLIYGGFIPALWGPTLVLTTSIFLGLPCNPVFLGTSFLLPLVVYSYDYVADLEKDVKTNPDRYDFNSRWGSKLTVLYLGLLVGLLLWSMNIWMVSLTASMFIIGVLYSKVFKGFTKRVPAFKNIYLGLIWSSCALMTVFIQNPHYPDITAFLVFAFLFLKVFINTVFCDYKDIESDRAEGLKTLPAVFGVEKSIRILQSLNVLTASTILVGILIGALPLIALCAIGLCLYTSFYLRSHSRMAIDTATLMADIEGPLHLPLVILGAVP